MKACQSVFVLGLLVFLIGVAWVGPVLSAAPQEPTSPTISETLEYLNKLVRSDFVPIRNGYIAGKFSIDVRRGIIWWSRSASTGVTHKSSDDSICRYVGNFNTANVQDLDADRVMLASNQNSRQYGIDIPCKSGKDCWQQWSGTIEFSCDEDILAQEYRSKLIDNLLSLDSKPQNASFKSNFAVLDIPTTADDNAAGRFIRAMQHLIRLQQALPKLCDSNGDPFAANCQNASSEIDAAEKGVRQAKEAQQRQQYAKGVEYFDSISGEWTCSDDDSDKINGLQTTRFNISAKLPPSEAKVPVSYSLQYHYSFISSGGKLSGSLTENDTTTIVRDPYDIQFVNVCFFGSGRSCVESARGVNRWTVQGTIGTDGNPKLNFVNGSCIGVCAYDSDDWSYLPKLKSSNVLEMRNYSCERQ